VGELSVLIKRRHPEVQAEIDRVYQEHLAKLGKRRRDPATQAYGFTATNPAAGDSRGLAGILGAFTTPRKGSSVGWQTPNLVMTDQLELRFGGIFRYARHHIATCFPKRLQPLPAGSTGSKALLAGSNLDRRN
jgi:hypothetical protein